jgi:hypothetical protein
VFKALSGEVVAGSPQKNASTKQKHFPAKWWPVRRRKCVNETSFWCRARLLLPHSGLVS